MQEVQRVVENQELKGSVAKKRPRSNVEYQEMKRAVENQEAIRGVGSGESGGKEGSR